MPPRSAPPRVKPVNPSATAGERLIDWMRRRAENGADLVGALEQFEQAEAEARASVIQPIAGDRPEHYPSGEFDASKWATEFDRIFPDSRPDTGTMLSWFANALMTGYDAGKRDSSPGAPPRASLAATSTEEPSDESRDRNSEEER